MLYCWLAQLYLATWPRPSDACITMLARVKETTPGIYTATTAWVGC